MDDEVVAIESLAAGGAGLAHLADGIAVFVPRTAPGDRIRLRELRRHRRHADAQVAEVLEAGPGRASPPCAHFERDRCGGCQWQHLTPNVQAEAKRRIVGDALRRIGKLDVADPELVESARAFHYRTTITLTVRWRGAHPVVGFHDAAEPDRVFMLETCSIAREELNALWAAVRPALDALPRGDDVRLKLRLASDGSRHLVVDGGDGAWTGAKRMAEAAQSAGQPVSVWWHPARGAPRRMAGASADPAALAFEQVNAEVAALLRAAVIEAALGERADGRSGGRILDLYAGSGDTALPLAELGLEVTLVEIDERSVRRAEARAKTAALALRCIVGRVEDHIAKLLPADVVIVNPPRTGLSESVTARLAVFPSSRLIYVSCDPATLARDLRRLGVGAGDVATLKAFDMFPQTSHVETLVVVERRSG